MRRRAFLSVACALALPRIAWSQPAVRRIAILEFGNRATRTAEWAQFEARLRELGYVEGKNVATERRWADNREERLPQLAQELLAMRPEVVVVTTTPGTRALMRLTDRVPIVMAGVADPVAAGLVASLARPGGNVTGMSNLLTGVGVKRLELVLELKPEAQRIGFLGPAKNAGVQAVVKETQEAARSRGVELRVLDARDASEIAQAFDRFAAQPVDALITAQILLPYNRLIVDLAARHRIPVAYVDREVLDAGGLLAFGPAREKLYRHAADYTHRILLGASPADMPIVQESEFWLGVNLRTARALGLKVPQSLLLRADRVIE
jgi:putative ABC transport system substrate-binding protein